MYYAIWLRIGVYRHFSFVHEKWIYIFFDWLDRSHVICPVIHMTKHILILGNVTGRGVSPRIMLWIPPLPGS